MYQESKLSHYINKANSLIGHKFEKKIRVALLSSFTVNGLEEVLRVKSAEKNTECITYVGAYNQYNQEILDQESTLYKFSPDVTFLILDIRSIMGNLFHVPYSLSVQQRQDFIKKKVEEICNLAKIFTKSSKSKLVITNFSITSYSPYGIFETKTKYGFHDMIRDLNVKLTDAFNIMDSVYLFDFNRFVSLHGEKNVFDFQQFHFGDIKVSLDYIPYLAHDLMSYIIAVTGLSKKCIVLDLDNTLWGGIAGEDGFDGIKLGPTPPGNAYVEFQRYLLALYQRGIILAINSKNNLEDVLKIIRDHPNMILREENFACLKINWDDKVSNMKEIADQLNIGLDSMVFLDDDPINREYMRMNLPAVLTVELPQDPSHYAVLIQSMNEFNVLKITDEDTRRGKMYAQQHERKKLETSTPNLEEFLKQLELRVSIKNADTFTIPRISQLTLKTNQFNLSTKRYQEEDIARFAKDDKYLVRCAQVEDKFGDNGITGVFIVRKDTQKEWFIDTFLLSCRVMGREVEKGILGHIIKEAKNSGIEKIKAKFIPTNKNKPIENFLPNCGFQKEGEYWIYSLNSTFIVPNYLTVSVQ
jgi:FkbH-like protein